MLQRFIECRSALEFSGTENDDAAKQLYNELYNEVGSNAIIFANKFLLDETKLTPQARDILTDAAHRMDLSPDLESLYIIPILTSAASDQVRAEPIADVACHQRSADRILYLSKIISNDQNDQNDQNDNPNYITMRLLSWLLSNYVVDHNVAYVWDPPECIQAAWPSTTRDVISLDAEVIRARRHFGHVYFSNFRRGPRIYFETANGQIIEATVGTINKVLFGAKYGAIWYATHHRALIQAHERERRLAIKEYKAKNTDIKRTSLNRCCRRRRR